MKKIIFATHNPGKIIEMRTLLVGLPFQLLSADDVGIHEDVIEDCDTFEANALKKARFVAKKAKEISIADDSGLMIDALGGRPGVYSARWSGESGTEGLVRFTLDECKKIPQRKRTAKFVSVVALVMNNNVEKVFRGEITGKIASIPRGLSKPKLPYDTIFEPDEGNGKTFAEMSDEEKNSLSHRGKAFKELHKFLVTFID